MRGRLIIAFCVLLGCFIVATIVRVDQILFSDKLQWSEAQARAQSGALAGAIAGELKSTNRLLELSAFDLLKSGKDFSVGKPYSQFEMIAKLARNGTGDWQIEPAVFRTGSEVKSWASAYVVLALQNLKNAELAVGDARLISVLDPNRKVFFLVVTRLTEGWLAVIAKPDLFQAVVDRQKGLKSSVFAVNDLGQTLAHTTSEYVGTLMTEDPVVSQILRGESSSGSGVYELKGANPTQGLFEQITGTNLYVVVSVPLVEMMKERKAVSLQFVLLGVGFIFVALSLVLLIGNRESKKTGQPNGQTKALHLGPAPVPAASPLPLAPAVSSSAERVLVADPEERMKAYTQAASSLAHELKGPLLSLLGRARLLREQSENPELKNEMLKLEEGAREAHATLHKLLTFAGEKEEPSGPTSLSEVLQRTLRSMQKDFEVKSVTVESNLPTLALIEAQPLLLMKAFEQILKNSIEATDRIFEKKISVKLEQVDSWQKVTIQDNGEGIAEINLQKIFDPFFTTRDSHQHSGLGLSLALGIIRGCGGKVEVLSKKDQGATFQILFPMVAEQKAGAKTSIGHGVPKAPFQTPLSAEKVAQMPPPPIEDLPEVLNDHLMQKTLQMIDHLDGLEDLFLDQSLPKAPAAPVAPASESKLEAPVEMAATIDEPPPLHGNVKIDRPKISLQKKNSRLGDLGTDIRRPGDRT